MGIQHRAQIRSRPEKVMKKPIFSAFQYMNFIAIDIKFAIIILYSYETILRIPISRRSQLESAYSLYFQKASVPISTDPFSSTNRKLGENGSNGIHSPSLHRIRGSWGRRVTSPCYRRRSPSYPSRMWAASRIRSVRLPPSGISCGRASHLG